MAATLQSVANTAQGAATSLVSVAPTNPLPGDLMVASIRALGGSAFVAPAGWVSLGVATTGYAAFYKPVYSTEPSTYTFTWTGSGKASGLIALIRGQGGPYSFDPQPPAAQTNVSASTVIAPTITTTKVAAELLLSFYHSDAASTITPPGGQSSSGSIVGSGVAAIIGYETLAAVGATGTRTATSGAAISSALSIAFTSAYGAIGRGIVVWNNLRAMPVWRAGSPSLTDINSTQLTAIVAVDNFGLLTTNVSGVLSGTVKIAGVAQPYCSVFLYYRPTGQQIRKAVTDANGAFSFAGLDTAAVSNSSYFAIAVDPNGLGTQYNSLVYDRLIPS